MPATVLGTAMAVPSTVAAGTADIATTLAGVALPAP